MNQAGRSLSELSAKLVYDCAYSARMEYEWDSQKATSNLRKHGIDFADAIFVFADDFAITVVDEHPDEERFVTIGMDAFSRVLVVVYTWRGDDCIRIISARKATRHEQKQYKG